MRIFYNKVGGYIKTFSFDDDLSKEQQDSAISSNLVEVPKDVLATFSREDIEDYMSTYDAQDPSPIPEPKSDLYRHGEDLDMALAEYFGSKTWASGALTGAQIVSLIDAEIGTAWKTGGGGTNNAPVVSNQSGSVDIDTDLVLSLGNSVDADGDTITYTSNPTSGITISGTNATFNIASAGTHTYTITGSDGKGGSGVGTITITVTDPNANITYGANIDITGIGVN